MEPLEILDEVLRHEIFEEASEHRGKVGLLRNYLFDAAQGARDRAQMVKERPRRACRVAHVLRPLRRPFAGGLQGCQHGEHLAAVAAGAPALHVEQEFEQKTCGAVHVDCPPIPVSVFYQPARPDEPCIGKVPGARSLNPSLVAFCLGVPLDDCRAVFPVYELRDCRRDLVMPDRTCAEPKEFAVQVLKQVRVEPPADAREESEKVRRQAGEQPFGRLSHSDGAYNRGTLPPAVIDRRHVQAFSRSLLGWR